MARDVCGPVTNKGHMVNFFTIIKLNIGTFDSNSSLDVEIPAPRYQGETLTQTHAPQLSRIPIENRSGQIVGWNYNYSTTCLDFNELYYSAVWPAGRDCVVKDWSKCSVFLDSWARQWPYRNVPNHLNVGMHCLKLDESGYGRPWVAHIIALKGSPIREYLEGIPDRRAAAPSLCFFLKPDELYEICEPGPINLPPRRRFCRVAANARLVEVPEIVLSRLRGQEAA